MTSFWGGPPPAEASTAKEYWERISAFEPKEETSDVEKVAAFFQKVYSFLYDMNLEELIKLEVPRADKFVLNGKTLYMLTGEEQNTQTVYDAWRKEFGNDSDLAYDAFALATQSATQGSTCDLYESCFHSKLNLMPILCSREVVVKTGSHFEVVHHIIMAIKRTYEDGPVNFRYLEMNIEICIGFQDFKKQNFSNATVKKTYTAFQKWVKPCILSLEHYQEQLQAFKEERRGVTELDIEETFLKVYQSCTYDRDLRIENRDLNSWPIPDHFCSFIRNINEVVIKGKAVSLPSELAEDAKARLIGFQCLSTWPDDRDLVDLIIHCPIAPFVDAINKEMYECFNYPKFAQFVFSEGSKHTVHVHDEKVTIENQLVYVIKNARGGNEMSIDGSITVNIKMVIPKDTIKTENYSDISVESSWSSVSGVMPDTQSLL